MRYLTFGLVALLVSPLFSLITNGAGIVPNAYAQINDTFETAPDLPYLLDYSKLLNEDQSADSLSGIQPKFRSWGGANLIMSSIKDENDITLSRIDGSVGGQPAGFISENLDFQARYVLLTTGNITKSKDSQLSFALGVTNSSSEYRLIFVHGPLSIEGWRDRNYYEKLESYSSRLIDLKNLLSSRTNNYSLEEITIVMQKETSYSAEFRIDLNLRDSDIIRTGNIQHDRYVMHDLSFKRLVGLEFQATSTEYEIVNNGWTLTDVKERKDETTGLTTVSLTANAPSSGFPADLFKLDILESFSNLGAKDWLLLIFVLLPATIYPFKVVKK